MRMSHADQTFCESMRIVRKSHGMSIERLAKEAKLPADRVRKIDAGEVNPYLHEALKIADALNVSVDALMRGAVSKRGLGVYRHAIENLPTQADKGDEEPK